jgi:hypothetical protein
MTKKEELMTMIGKETSDNYSPTLRSKLIAIYDTHCIWEIAPNQWNDEGNETEGESIPSMSCSCVVV